MRRLPGCTLKLAVLPSGVGVPGRHPGRRPTVVPVPALDKARESRYTEKNLRSAMPLAPEMLIAFAVTALAVVAGAAVDVVSKRIPNLITFGAMLVLVAVHTAFSGLPGLTDALYYAAWAAACFFLSRICLGCSEPATSSCWPPLGPALARPALVTVVLFTKALPAGVQVFIVAGVAAFFAQRTPGYRLCYGPAIATAGTLAAMALPLRPALPRPGPAPFLSGEVVPHRRLRC